MNLADRIVGGGRVQEQARGYGIDRAPITTVSAAERWLRDWRSAEGDCVWRPVGESSREHIGGHLLWLRFLYHERWIERGGRHG